MLTLDINNKQLLTGKKFSCRISVKNPFFMFNELRGPLAADISIPSEGNMGTLNHPNRVTKLAKQNDRHFSGATLRHNGIPFITGDLVIDEASGEVSGWIQNHMGKLGEELRGKNLTELSILANQAFTNKTTFDPDSDFWCTIKLMNKGFWKDRGITIKYTAIEKDLQGNDVEIPDTEIESLSKKFMDEAAYFVNKTTAGGVHTSAGTDGVAVVSPFPFLHSLVDQVLRQNQFYISDNFLKLDADLKTLCLYHNSTILKDTTTKISGLFSIYNFFLNQYESINLEELDTATWDLANFSIADLMPNIKLKDLLLGIQNTTNVFLWTDNNRNVKIIDRESILTGNSFDLNKYRVTPWIPGERKDVILKFSWEHDDDDSAFKETFENLDDKRHKILTAVSTRSDLDSILLPKTEGDIRLVGSENVFYEYKWHTISASGLANEETEVDVLGWKAVSSGMQNYFFNDGDKDVEEIKSIFSTPRMSADGHPVVFQRGNSKTFGSISEPFSPRLMFYKGNNSGGDESSSGLKFDWKGDNGIVRKRFALTAPFLANRLPMTAKFRFPSRIMYYVLNNIYQKYKDIYGEFLIEEMNADPGANDSILAELKVFKVEDNFWAFNPGAVVGGGDGTQITFTPKFVGVNQYGKPYLIDENGGIRTTSVFGSISTVDYAHNCCVFYDATLKQLFVGGNDGFLHIYDVTSNFRMRSVQMYDDYVYHRPISCVAVCNGQIIIGVHEIGVLHSMPTQANIDNYVDLAAEYQYLPGVGGGWPRDFVYVDGNYFCCTRNGHVLRTTDPQTTWTELFNYSANFTRLAVSTTRIYAFEMDDRPFYCMRSDTDSWTDFDMEAENEPEAIEATAKGETVVAITTQYYNPVYIITSPVRETIVRPNAACHAKGVCFDSEGNLFVAAKQATNNSGMLLKLVDNYMAWQFNLPEGLNIYTY